MSSVRRLEVHLPLCARLFNALSTGGSMSRQEDGSYRGWIRGDLIAVAPGVQVATSPALPVTEESIPKEPVSSSTQSIQAPRTNRPALSMRRDWSRHLVENLEAVKACVETGSAQPAVATNLRVLQRELVEIVIRDAALRQWKCVVRGTGGTPMRFDPMFNNLGGSQSPAPYFTLREEAEPTDGSHASDCLDVEPISGPDEEMPIGWLVYTAC